MKLFWTGTDSLMLIDYSMRSFRKKVYWQLFRIVVRVMELFIEEHYAVSPKVEDNLRRFKFRKKITIRKDYINYLTKYPKVKHKGFNVLYYSPITRGDISFMEWIYGIDIINVVKQYFYGSDVNFIMVDGSDKMGDIFPIIDFYLRPNRHDGASRLIDECEIQEIHYYLSITNPNIDDAIKAIEDVKQNKK